jgi:hypothetical protein
MFQSSPELGDLGGYPHYSDSAIYPSIQQRLHLFDQDCSLLLQRSLFLYNNQRNDEDRPHLSIPPSRFHLILHPFPVLYPLSFILYPLSFPHPSSFNL